MSSAMSFVFSLFLFFVVSYAITSPSDYLNKNDATRLEKILLSHKTGDSFGTVQETYQALFSLQELGVKLDSKDKYCMYAAKILNTDTDVRNLLYALRITSQLDCPKVQKLNSEQTKSVQSALEGTLEELFFGASILLENKFATETDLNDVVDTLLSLELEEGVFVEPDVEPSYYVTGLTLQLFAKFYKFYDLSSDDRDRIEALDLAGVLGTATERDSALVFLEQSVSSPGNVPATASVFSGINALLLATQSSGYGIRSEQIVQLTEYFVTHKHVSTIQDIYFLLVGLRTASKSSLGAPVVLTLASEVVSSSGKDASVIVRVTDVYGKAVPQMKVTLNSATLVTNPANSIVTGQEFKPVSTAEGNTDYSLNLFASRPEHGFYELDISTSSTNKFIQVKSASRMLKLVTAVSVTDCSLRVIDSEESDFASPNIIPCGEFGQTLSDLITANYYQRVELSFKLKSQSKTTHAHQTFVHLWNKEDASQEATVIAKFTEKRYVARLNLAKISDDKKLRSGVYNLELYVGDSLFSNSFTWKISEVELTTLLPPGVVERRALLSAKPEINHQFRVPEKRPPAALSFAFTGLVLLPLLLFVFGSQSLKINSLNFPTDGNSMPAALFHVLLGAILVIYVLFWLKVNMITTLTYAGFLALPTYFCGHKVLESLSAAKEKAE